MQLRLPSKATGRIKFEILDAAGNLIFSREEEHQLERGRNLITSSRRLPIHDQRALDGGWNIRISADNVLLAVHEFNFSDSANESIKRHIGEDGEINTELRAAMAESSLPKMSLDELLSYQEEEEARRNQS